MYDLIIIGAGAAGIACAKEALKLGLKALLVERHRDFFGGTCLNHGCIPAKFFLNSCKYNKSWPDVYQQKEELIEKIKRPLFGYLQQKGVDIRWGEASLVDSGKIKIDGQVYDAKNIVIASGSSPRKIFDHEKGMFAQDLFSRRDIPARFLIVGAGYIGIETACLLKGFAKDVVVVEKEDRILPGFDHRLANRLRVILETRGIKIDTGVDIVPETAAGYDSVLLAAGRDPQTAGLDIEAAGIKTEGPGWIKTDIQCRTSCPRVYACGDVTGKNLLAYTAEHQAMVCVQNIAGKKCEEDYQALPRCVFSDPQLAKVGMLEDEAKDRNIKYRTIRSNFLKFSCAHVYNDTDGFVEIVIDDKDKVIGAGVISRFAAELIAFFTLCIRTGSTVQDLRKCVLVHPSIAEIVPLLLRESDVAS